MSRPIARPKPLADFIETCLGRSLAAQGFAAADVITAWPEIAGARLCEVSRPVRVDWPRRGPGADPEARAEPAALVLRVESAFAIEVQHLAPIIIERVNAHYGWRCIGRLVLKQGPVTRKAPRQAEMPLSEGERARIEAVTGAVDEEPLRAALDRLGSAVVRDAARETRTKA